MATLANPSPPKSPPFHRRRRSFARRCERFCCSCISFLPLVFVYGLTTWAVWVQASIGFLPSDEVWTGKTSAFVGIALYILLNWSYTTAVFVDPGSPLTPTKDSPYSVLPTAEPRNLNDSSPHEIGPTFTVKSTGELRYCKKCQTRKPDRAHHCSTCRRCVLKMDHHCPWLATCVGFRNYKAFLLFLTYTSIFCWVCSAVSVTWVWSELLDRKQFEDQLMPINYVLLAVLGGIIGLVLTGFTIWHIWLACCGQTTIESLEKQRYLTPSKRPQAPGQDPQRNYIGPGSDQLNEGSAQSFADQLRTIHANALPGITRQEEGEEAVSVPPSGAFPSSAESPARDSLRQIHNNPRNSFRDLENQREHDRYAAYLDELDSEKLPNAFDLGWRRNLVHLLGESPWLRWLPICNTTGDGWSWETSQKWHEAREKLGRERQARARENEAFDRDARETRERWQQQGPPGGAGHSNAGVPLRTLSPQNEGDNDHDSSSDDDGERQPLRVKNQRATATSNWNDVPDSFLVAPRAGSPALGGGSRPRSRGSPRRVPKG